MRGGHHVNHILARRVAPAQRNSFVAAHAQLQEEPASGSFIGRNDPDSSPLGIIAADVNRFADILACAVCRAVSVHFSVSHSRVTIPLLLALRIGPASLLAWSYMHSITGIYI